MDKKGVYSKAFIGQSTITSVNFSSQCSFIGDEAFFNCISLEKINENNVIETIGISAFAGTKLSSANFTKLNNMYDCAFMNCTNLSYISIPQCTSIQTSTFAHCVSLKEIDASNTTIIGENAFLNCGNLTSINIPKCNTISTSAFANCSNLVNVSINETEIQDNAFENCLNLKDIYLDNCSSIEQNAFLNCQSLDKINLNKCLKIGSSAFYNTTITQLTLSSCQEIYPFAFANCPNLTKVYIKTPDVSCLLMGDNVFCMHDPSTSTCLRNENIVFYFKPNTLEYYKSAPYWSHYADNMIMITNEREMIYITNDNKPIEFISYDNSDSDSDNDYTHGYYNEKFGLISFNYDIITLNNQIFKKQKTLISVDLPSACEIIEESAFEDCENLQSITLSEFLMEIQDSAFKNCKSLTQFEIPDTIITLGESIFAGCENIIKFQGKSNFIKNNGNALVYNNTLICVLPNDDSYTEGRIYKISEIDENITRLGKSCFSGCKKLRRVDISPKVTEIGDNAFEGCINLREIHFSDTIPNIGENAFGTSVRDDLKIFVPENMLEQYNETWKNTQYVEYIYPMPNDTDIICYTKDNEDINVGQSVDNNNCTNGKYYKISNMINVPDNLFAGENITKVILGNKITSLGEYTFEMCEELNYIYLPDSINHIGDYCFSECVGFESIHIPKLPISAFGINVFNECNNLKEFESYHKGYVSDDNRCYIDNNTLLFFAHGYNQFEDDLSTYKIPSNITHINEYAFKDSKYKNIELSPNTVSIGNYAFLYSELESIENWDSVKEIGNYAFSHCKKLDKISLPNNLTKIGSYAFNLCTNMYINTNIPDNVTSIGAGAFYGCTKFKYLNTDTEKQEIIKLNNITSIPSSLFNGCEELSEIEISSKVTQIGEYAFKNCTNLTSIISSNTSGKFERLTDIGAYAFYGCTNLKNFDLDKAYYIQIINQYAFYNCSKYKGGNSGELLLTNILPAGICAYSFSGSGIEKLKISSSCRLNTIQPRAFFQCNNLKCVDMSKSIFIQHIDSYAFGECTHLENIKLSNSIVSINDYAFNLCENIFYIKLPTKLKILGERCFAFNNNATEIHIPNRLRPPVFSKNGVDNANVNIFDTKLPKIICKNNTDTNTYINNTYWKKYSPLISTGSQINIDMENAYLEYNTLGNKYKIANIGKIDTSRHIYLYNSLWQCYKNAPFSFSVTTSPYDIMLIVDKESLKEWYNKYDGDTHFYYNISIPMITNDNKKFRILYNISLKSYLSTSASSYTINVHDVMLSMNTSTYNGEDYDNIAHFYYNKNLSGELQLQINRYKPNYGVQINTVNVPGELKKDILPSRVYMNSLNGQELYKISTLTIDGWTNFDDINISDYFSLLQNFKNLNYSFSDMLDVIGMSSNGVCIDFEG